MTERGLPLADGATACPFVAFEDDRDERASVPDHRHRCYAEQRPAPRALAHQEAYCLSSAFPVCPTFQDWARREAARARGDAPGGGRTGGSAHEASSASLAPSATSAMLGAAAAASPDHADRDDLAAAAAFAAEPPNPTDAGRPSSSAAGAGGDDDGDEVSSYAADRDDEPVQRNPPRDWAAPPPWLASSDANRPFDDAEPPSFLGHRSDPAAGLAGSTADQMAGGAAPSRRTDSAIDPWAAGAAAAAGAAGAASGAAGSGSGGGAPGQGADEDEYGIVDAPPNRVTRRPRAYDQHLGGPDGPDWEKPRRYEAYPTIKARVGMPQVPRLVLTAGLVALLAVALFFLPGFLNLGGGGGSPAGASPSPSTVVKASREPTAPPAPTPVVYTVKKGDTLTKIAKAHGLTLEELLTANPDIKNPNKVSEGQQLVIPAPSEAPPDAVESPAKASAAP